MKYKIPRILLAGIWITFSEFLRNEILFKSYWVRHFGSLGLEFKTLPLNGILWLVWSLLLAFLIFTLRRKLRPGEAVLLAWLAAFVMMWITAFNLRVLPLKLLLFAVPLSLLEAAVAGFIVPGRSAGSFDKISERSPRP